MPKRKFIPIPTLSQRDIQTFWSKVDKRSPDECWPWTGASGKHGLHGKFSVYHGPLLGASRVSFFLATGTDPEVQFVCHKCDNPPCVNPSHLWLGGYSENAKDAVAKGRWNSHPPHLCGEQVGTSTFKESQVVDIRRRHAAGEASYTALAKEFGVTKSAIAFVVRRRSWKHVA